jgi:general secretion pathway protein A
MKLIYRTFRQAEGVIPGSGPEERMISSPPPREQGALLRVDLLDSYKSFFGFKESPFSVAPDPRFFFFSHSAAEGLNHLRYGIYEGLGFTMLTGEPGTGKTMLARYFLSKCGEDLRITHLSDPRLSDKEILLTLLGNLGMERSPEGELSQRDLTQRLYQTLLLASQQGKRVVILLDEAQGLTFESLEGLRLLSNLERGSQKLIQIVLLGQTELEERLKERRLRQLDQRILVRYRLVPLETEEIGPYIKHQLMVAQLDKQVEFTPGAEEKIYQLSEGLPRLVNVLCERAMMSGFVGNSRRIEVKNVLEGWESLNRIKLLERRRI